MTQPAGTTLFTLTSAEVEQLASIDRMAMAREAFGECLWLHISAHQRRWVLESSHGRCVVTVDAEHGADVCDMWLPVSIRIIHFAHMCPEDVTLSLVDDSVVASTEGRSAVVDLVANAEGPPEEWRSRDTASAEIERAGFFGTIYAARFMPRGGDEVDAPAPPMWLQMADGTVAIHVDWSEYVGGASTYRLFTKVCGGPATVAINHPLVSQWSLAVGGWLEDDETTMRIAIREILVDGTRRDAVWFSASGAELTLWCDDPLVERWGSRIGGMLHAAGLRDSRHDGRRWQVDVGGVPVDIVLHAGSPDVARVSAPVVGGVEPTLELLTEINAVNAAATGVRMWVEDGLVVAASDVRCPELDGLETTVRQVAAAAARYQPLLAALGVTG